MYLLFHLPVRLPRWLDTESHNAHAWPIPQLEYIVLTGLKSWQVAQMALGFWLHQRYQPDDLVLEELDCCYAMS